VAPPAGVQPVKATDSVAPVYSPQAAPPAPPPPPPPAAFAKTEEPPAAPPQARMAEPRALAGSNVARSRIGSVTAAPSAEVADSSIVVTGSRIAAPSAGRGDWNACTVEDPGRNLGRCRTLVDPSQKGAGGQAAAHVADGLERAWEGDLDGAIRAFDQAIAIAPRSSFAYLNRGLAYKRSGDLGRALADLDRAVRYAPGDARAYYNRSLVLRQRGDTRRARADEQRAADLDPRYAEVVE
jgi:hypothetical protein